MSFSNRCAPLNGRRRSVAPGHSRLAGVILAAYLGASGWAMGQTQPHLEFGDEVSVSWVLVPVVVSGRGESTADLERSDFELFIDGHSVAIDGFEGRNGGPISVLVLQDTSGSMANGGSQRASRTLSRALLAAAIPGDQYALATFAGRETTLAVPFTADVARVEAAIDNWSPWGTTALHDAIAGLPAIGIDRHRPRRAALLLTDGADNNSVLEPAVARDIIAKTEVPLFVLQLTGRRQESREHSSLTPHEAELAELSRATAGRYQRIFDGDDLEAIMRSIGAELRHQYVLGFPVASGNEDRVHDIEVRVRGRNQHIKHRLSYHGPPPAHPDSGQPIGRSKREGGAS